MHSIQLIPGEDPSHWQPSHMPRPVPCLDPGGGTQVHRALRISLKKGSFFKTSACPQFCKRMVLFCTQVWGSKSPYNLRNIRGSDAE